MAEATPTVHFEIDGQKLEAPAGTTIISAAHAAGIEIPFFCYHPGLEPVGNCRMCLVEVARGRKPVAACVTPVGEGIEVFTESPEAREARRGVLELMLINHPLDCPICDKSGECMLQDNTYNHGPDSSRMVEFKELRPTKDLGPGIALWGNRCISCTRCVRFCDEVSGSGELAIVNRGDHSVVDVFEGYPLDNPLAINTVDICPVGALISHDFLYEARVWNLQKTKSVCPGCARGCNITVETLRNEVKRLMPRHNAAVNDYWMCDRGRLDYRYIESDRRLVRHRLPPTAVGKRTSGRPDVVPFLVDGLRATVDAHGAGAVAGVASAFMTLEELYLFGQLFKTLGTDRVGALTRPSTADETFPGFRISGDGNPNRAGVEKILGTDALGKTLEGIADGIREGRIRALVMVADLPHQPLDDEWVELLGTLDFAAVFLLDDDSRAAHSVAILPATATFEKTGTMINEDGIVQRLRTAIQTPSSVGLEIELFQEVLMALGAWERVLSPDGVFRKLGETIPELKGQRYLDVGDLGLKVQTMSVEMSSSTL